MSNILVVEFLKNSNTVLPDSYSIFIPSFSILHVCLHMCGICMLYAHLLEHAKPCKGAWRAEVHLRCLSSLNTWFVGAESLIEPGAYSQQVGWSKSKASPLCSRWCWIIGMYCHIWPFHECCASKLKYVCVHCISPTFLIKEENVFVEFGNRGLLVLQGAKAIVPSLPVLLMRQCQEHRN